MAHATFADLPPEMVGNVFAFIRSKPHKSNVCLVSRAFRDVMAPMLWERFKADFRDVTPRLLATLLHPSQPGILSHVREISFIKSPHSTTEEEHLRSVISAIPQDRIRRFASEHKVSTLTLQVLLRSQHKIDCLHVLSDFTTPGLSKPSHIDSQEQDAWTGSSLPEVSELLLDIQPRKSSYERILQDLRTISRYSPKIKCLTLEMVSSEGSEGTTLSEVLRQDEEPCLFPNLTFLRLFDMDIAAKENKSICDSFDVSRLKCLELSHCNRLIPLLEHLTSIYTRDTSDLISLIILLPTELQEPKNTIKAIDDLLMVCSKLRCLWLEFLQHGFVAKTSVLAHCQTLQTLTIGNGNSDLDSHFPVADMTELIGACTKLRMLGVNMPVVRAQVDAFSDMSMNMNGEFAEILTAVSMHPTLRAFRILNPPKVSFDDDDYGECNTNEHRAFCQILMQDYANKIFRHMPGPASKLKVLSIKPITDETDEEVARDVNGHQWPVYNYVRGRLFDATGTSVIVAHPSKYITLDFPGMAFFLQHI